MKNPLPVFLLLCTFFSFASGPYHADPQSQEIIAPVKAVFEGFFHQDAADMTSSFSPDATFISTHGQKAIEDKHFSLFLLTGPLRTQYKWSDLQLKQLSANIPCLTLHFSTMVYTGDKLLSQQASCSAILQNGKEG